MRTLAILLSTILLATTNAARPGAQEQPAWTLTTGDFATRRVRLVEIGDSGLGLIQPDGQSTQVPTNGVVRLERSGTTPAPAADGARFVLHLRGGDRLIGRPVRLTDSALVMDTPPFGEVEVPLEQLLALIAGPSSDRPWRLPQPPADEVILANGDQLRGYLSALEGEQWTFSDEQGNETPLAASAVSQVRFADPGVAAPPAPETGWRIRPAAGGVLTLDSLGFAEGRFTLSYRGREAQVDEVALAWLEPVNGPVRWLGDLPMTSQEHVPYLGAAFPILVDELPGGGRGFTVHSRSRLVFDLPPGYDRFRTLYALDRSMSHGNADVRILLDDKVVHEKKGLTAGDEPGPVEVPLDGATRLTLEVDYGEGLDVQDVVHWINPALVRNADRN
jgi:hypothetical protein